MHSVVAGENTSDDKDRIYVDHADGDCRNDTADNLHWVTPSFNTFNKERKGNSSGYFGVRQNGRKFLIHTAPKYMPYPNAKTAARVYDLVCTLKYGDQLRKTPHLLNNLDQDRYVSLIEKQSDGVSIYRVDDLFVVIYDARVDETAEMLQDAKAAAKPLKEKLQREREEREKEWRNKIKSAKITRNKDGVAVLKRTTRATDNEPSKVVEVLLDDNDWIDIWARSIDVYIALANGVYCTDANRVTVPLSRWLCKPRVIDVVDHVNRDIYDHRRSNLANRSRAANLQNSRRTDPNGTSKFHGVQWRWKAGC